MRRSPMPTLRSKAASTACRRRGPIAASASTPAPSIERKRSTSRPIPSSRAVTPPVRGSFDVRELFTEVQIPIVSHSFFEELTLTGGFRYSDYKVADNHFSTNTYKIAGEFAPVRDIRARASYNRAVRAPNIVELFGPTSLGLAGGTDPCAGSSPQFTAEQCFNTFKNTNFTLAQVQGIFAACVTDPNACIATNPANQYGAFAGGNPNLKPETADT